MYGSFLIKFLNWGVTVIISELQVFHTFLSNSSILHVLDTCFDSVNHLLSILIFIQKHSPRQILRLLEMRFIYCVDPDLDLNFMHMFAQN